MDKQERHKAIIIATHGRTTNLLYNELHKHWDIVRVIIEDPTNKRELLKRRAKKVGYYKMMEQVGFLAWVPLFLSSKKRTSEIISSNSMSDSIIDEEKLRKIDSVNNPIILEAIKKYDPKIIFINGTRIIAKEILDQINVPIINIHVGITPKYRGVHGGYWAQYNEDPDHFGVTVHLVDSGIDTGQVIAQQVLSPSKKDNYSTYPILQFVNGIKLIIERKTNINSDKIKTTAPITTDSKLYYHPGITQYILKRITKGIK